MTAVLTVGREARLKPEYAQVYPSIVPDRWDSAALMTDHMVAWLLGRGREGYILSDRILSDQHFEFRGESARQVSVSDRRSRHGDIDSEGWVPRASPRNPEEERERPAKSIAVLRGIALALGAERTSVFETVRKERLVLRMYIGARSTMIECTGLEVDHLVTDDFVGAQIHERIADALQTLKDVP